MRPKRLAALAVLIGIAVGFLSACVALGNFLAR